MLTSKLLKNLQHKCLGISCVTLIVISAPLFLMTSLTATFKKKRRTKYSFSFPIVSNLRTLHESHDNSVVHRHTALTGQVRSTSGPGHNWLTIRALPAPAPPHQKRALFTLRSWGDALGQPGGTEHQTDTWLQVSTPPTVISGHHQPLLQLLQTIK